jgi:hypothetical protein
MKKISLLQSVECFLLFIGVSLAASQPAHAYLDPSSGSYALQVAIAGLFGFLFSVKMFWGKMKQTLFPSRFGTSLTTAESTKDTPAASGND